MRLPRLFLPLALALVALAVPSLATAQTYQFYDAQIFNCTSPGYCISTPFYLGGDPAQPVSTLWFDVDLNAFNLGVPNPNYGVGHIYLQSGPLLASGCGDATLKPATLEVTDGTWTRNGASVQLIATVSESFTTTNGCSGTISLMYGHYYGSGSGRGGGGAGWKTTLSAATLNLGGAQ